MSWARPAPTPGPAPLRLCGGPSPQHPAPPRKSPQGPETQHRCHRLQVVFLVTCLAECQWRLCALSLSWARRIAKRPASPSGWPAHSPPPPAGSERLAPLPGPGRVPGTDSARSTRLPPAGVPGDGAAPRGAPANPAPMAGRGSQPASCIRGRAKSGRERSENVRSGHARSASRARRPPCAPVIARGPAEAGPGPGRADRGSPAEKTAGPHRPTPLAGPGRRWDPNGLFRERGRVARGLLRRTQDAAGRCLNLHVVSPGDGFATLGENN